MARLPISAAAAMLLFAVAGAAWAEDQDAPVATSNGGWVDDSLEAVPAPVAPPVVRHGDPLAAVREAPRKGILGLHGSAGVVIGSHDTRGAFATVHGPIGDNAHFSLSFSTLHSDAAPYGFGYGYGGHGYGGYHSPFYGSQPYYDYGAPWPGFAPSAHETTTDVTDQPGG